jgi:tripartite-type tricarboxylate transporter receptor subunit TctC
VLFWSLAAVAFDTRAGPYPERPIKLVVATTAGSLPDIVARLLGERLAASTGQAVVVENRPGAVGTIGLGQVAKARPDGYTLGIATLPLVVAPSLIPRLPYDVEKDFSPVAIIGWNYAVLAIRSSLPVHSIPQLIDLAKSKQGTLRYSSPGNATPGHLGMKLFEQQTGVELVHVPYKGQPAATMALLQGDVDMCLAGMLTMSPHVKSGAVRALATMAPRRLTTNPELPTMIEYGYPELKLIDFHGLVAPAGTPPEVIERLRTEVADIVAKPEVRSRLEQMSMEPVGLGPIEFRQLIQSETIRWSRFVREAQITVE